MMMYAARGQRKFLWLQLCVLVSIPAVVSGSCITPDICSSRTYNNTLFSDNDIAFHSGLVRETCHQMNFSFSGRCCMTKGDSNSKSLKNGCSGSTVYGLDLRNCSFLGEFRDLTRKSLLNVACLDPRKLSIVDLSRNENASRFAFNEEFFRGFSSLNRLILPESIDCPNGPEAWNATANLPCSTLDSDTDLRWSNFDQLELTGGTESDKNMCRVCQGITDICHREEDSESMGIFGGDDFATLDLDDGGANSTFACPEHSTCVPDGPGLSTCACLKGHYDYQCLKGGRFPFEAYFSSLAVASLLATGLVWFFQRRHVGKFTDPDELLG